MGHHHSNSKASKQNKKATKNLLWSKANSPVVAQTSWKSQRSKNSNFESVLDLISQVDTSGNFKSYFGQPPSKEKDINKNDCLTIHNSIKKTNTWFSKI